MWGSNRSGDGCIHIDIYPHPYCITNNEFVWSFVLILHHHEVGGGSKKSETDWRRATAGAENGFGVPWNATLILAQVDARRGGASLRGSLVA